MFRPPLLTATAADATTEPFTREAYDAAGAWGLASAIDLYACDPIAIRSPDTIGRFTRELCDLIGVKRYGEPQIVRFGREPRVYGYSMVQLIETSLVSAHFAEESDAVYLDIFSCQWYDAAVATSFSAQTFGAKHRRTRSWLRG